MKKQIRVGVFETNSSSTHSLTLCSEKDYQKWASGEVLFNEWGSNGERFVTKKEVETRLLKYYKDYEIEEINLADEGYYTEEEYFDDWELETFKDKYITPNGEKIIAFGKFGYDG